MIKLATKVFFKSAVKTATKSFLVYGIWTLGKEFGRYETNKQNNEGSDQ